MSILTERWLWSTDAWKYWTISCRTNEKESDREEKLRYKTPFKLIRERLNARQ